MASLMSRKVFAPAQAMQRRACACPSPLAPRQAVVACAQAPATGPAKFLPQLMACGLAATLLLGAPNVQAADMRTLADVSRADFAFVDANKDGVITQEEISAMALQVAQEEELDTPTPELLNFSLRVFDLNQDGKLTTEEMLAGLALDTSVSEDDINPDVVQVFDKDKNGTIDPAEWKAGMGSLGPNGEELKEYTFRRVDYLSDRDGRLDADEFSNALTLMRIMVLGY